MGGCTWAVEVPGSAHAGPRQASLLRGKAQGVERRLLGGLEDDAVAGGQGGGHLPGLRDAGARRAALVWVGGRRDTRILCVVLDPVRPRGCGCTPAAAVLRTSMSSGKFQGMIWPTTPMGCGGVRSGLGSGSRGSRMGGWEQDVRRCVWVRAWGWVGLGRLHPHLLLCWRSRIYVGTQGGSSCELNSLCDALLRTHLVDSVSKELAEAVVAGDGLAVYLVGPWREERGPGGGGQAGKEGRVQTAGPGGEGEEGAGGRARAGWEEAGVGRCLRGRRGGQLVDSML